MQAFNCLNDIQKEENPNAYEPEVVKTINAINAREERLNHFKKQQEDLKQEKLNQALEHDRALFDFDEDINNLEEVKERYPAVAVPNFIKEDEEKPVDERQEEEPTKVEVPAKPPIDARFQVKRAVRPTMP